MIRFRSLMPSIRVLAVFVPLAAALLPRSAPATPMPVTQGSEGFEKRLAVSLAESPDRAVRRLDEELRMGNLLFMGSLAKALEGQPGSEVDKRLYQAYYAIYAASVGRLEAAGEAIERARAVGPAGSLLLHFADSLRARRSGAVELALEHARAAVEEDERHPYGWNLLGRAQVENGELRAASESFERAIELSPRFQSAYLNLGSTAYLEGDLDRARASYEAAVNLPNPSDGTFYNLARVYLEIGKLPQALEAINRSLSLNPNRGGAYDLLSEINMRLGRFEAASRAAAQLAEYDPGRSALLEGRARLYLGQVEKAVALLNRAPMGVGRSNELGFAALISGDYETAEARFTKALEQSPGDQRATLALAVTRFYVGKDVESVVSSNEESPDSLSRFMNGLFLAADSDWHGAYTNLSRAEGLDGGYRLIGVSQEELAAAMRRDEIRPLALAVLFHASRYYRPARDLLQDSVSRGNASMLSSYWLARTLDRMGQRQASIVAHEKAIANAPRFFASLFELGDQMMALGRPDVASRYYERAADIEGSSGVLIRLGLAHEAMGRLSEAARAYERAIRYSPGSYPGYNQLAWLYARQGIKLEEALELARKADAIQPDNSSILDTLGWIEFQRGNARAALGYLERAFAVRPDDPVILYHLAAVESELGIASLPIVGWSAPCRSLGSFRESKRRGSFFSNFPNVCSRERLRRLHRAWTVQPTRRVLHPDPRLAFGPLGEFETSTHVAPDRAWETAFRIKGALRPR